MGTGSVDERGLTAWLCTHLPMFTDSAARYRWEHKLNAAISDIRAGVPATEAVVNHHLPIDLAAAGDEQALIGRGDPSLLADLNIDPVTVVGPYTCPATLPCPRRSRPDEHGHEPRCAVYGRTMTLRGR